MALPKSRAGWLPGARKGPDRNTSRFILFRGLAVIIVLMAIDLAGARFSTIELALQRLEFLSYDAFLSTLPSTGPVAEVVIVDIDEESLRRYGQWPWPRDRFAKLLTRIQGADPAAIGIDFIFSEPDELSIERMVDRIETKSGIAIDTSGLSDELLSNDHALGAVLDDPRVVSAVWMNSETNSAVESLVLPLPQSIVRESKGALTDTVPVASSGDFPVPALLESTRHVGFVNSLADSDGPVRRLQLLYKYGDQFVPALSLATVMVARGEDTIHIHATSIGIESIVVGETTLPTDHQASMYIPFRRPYEGQFEHRSAGDLLDATVDTTVFRDAIVLVGSSATALHDASPVPGEPNMKGVQIHAIAAAAMLRQDFIRTLPLGYSARLFSIAMAGALVTILLAWQGLRFCVATIAGVLAVLVLGAGVLFITQGIYISPVLPVATIIVASLVLGASRIRGEERRVLESTRDLALAQDCAILGLVSVAETRDPETGSHILRTQHYIRVLARELANSPEYRSTLTPDNIEAIYRSAPLHDIGKVGVPDNILLKSGKLTDDEFEIMKLHTVRGHEVLTHAQRMAGLDSRSSFLTFAAEIALSHHEKWDGSGYPRSLANDKIPLSARLMALADVYDALRSRRHYKNAFSHDKTRELIVTQSGTHFDPEVVRAFEATESQFISIARRYAEEDASLSQQDYPELDA